METKKIPSKVRSAARRFRSSRAEYYDYLATRLEASKGNLKILQLFEQDAQRFEGKPRGILCAHWAEVYANNGANLADTWQGTLPDDEVVIVRISEDAGAGAIIHALRDVARIGALTDQIRSGIKGTLAAAVGAMLAASLMLTIYPIWGTTKLIDMFGFIPLEFWGPQGKSFVHYSELVKQYGAFAVFALIVLVTYVQWSVENLLGPARDWLDRKVILYRAIRDIKGAMFLSTMATLTRKRGNVMFTLRQSLGTFVSSTRSPWMRWRVQQVLDGIDRTGGVGSDAFNTNLISPEMFYFLRDMQEARGFAEGFEETGKYMESTVIKKVLDRMGVYRWVLLILALSGVLYVVGWQFSVIYEMKGVIESYTSMS